MNMLMTTLDEYKWKGKPFADLSLTELNQCIAHLEKYGLPQYQDVLRICLEMRANMTRNANDRC